MDEFVVYALYSRSSGKTYVGFTSDLINRFHSHNHYSTKGYTVRFRPWEVVHVEFFTTKHEAMVRERWVKSGVGREWLRANVIY
ncbi:GIY-YIG nuclease family protein [Chryseobacterium sp. cx-311]|uniref:GIY-YIG nuclease family protein n=1 Tax=Marnyiella aurantia TaxID=2758037 RepID=UPI001AE46AEA|nr:GIY-YIG nuclease family protein [Marnyiella aurantia]MBP0612240.1 GIY-YIG nuclease family protein [Marnyiella aurantia]